MVTPSLVMVGEPNFLSRSAYRPRGPRVTLTASAILSTPRFSARRASSSNRICFATLSFVLLKMRPPACRGDRLLDDGQDVLLGEDQQILFVELELGPGVLLEENPLPDGDVDRLAGAVIQDPSRSDRQDRPLLGALLDRVRQDDAALGHLLARCGLDDQAIPKGLEP